MKLISILHQYIQQAILYKPPGIQNSTRIFQYVFSNTFQHYSSYISVGGGGGGGGGGGRWGGGNILTLEREYFKYFTLACNIKFQQVSSTEKIKHIKF